MRTLLILLIECSLLSACKEEPSGGGDPAVYYDYFRFVDAATGKDLFLGSNRYHLDSLQRFVKDINGQISPVENLPYTENDTAIIFRTLGFYEFSLYKFSEYDIDTVENVRKCEKTVGGEDCSIVYNSKIYYNGTLVDEFDFEHDKELFMRLLETNGPTSGSPNKDTYIITFRKEVEH